MNKPSMQANQIALKIRAVWGKTFDAINSTRNCWQSAWQRDKWRLLDLDRYKRPSQVPKVKITGSLPFSIGQQALYQMDPCPSIHRVRICSNVFSTFEHYCSLIMGKYMRSIQNGAYRLQTYITSIATERRHWHRTIQRHNALLKRLGLVRDYERAGRGVALYIDATLIKTERVAEAQKKPAPGLVRSADKQTHQPASLAQEMQMAFQALLAPGGAPAPS